MGANADSRDRTGEEVAGRYVIEGEIGRGGMGAVFAARDTRLGRRVALKTISADSNASTRQRLETEARAVASIEHPGIVTLFDVVEHAGETVLVMELVAGESLRSIVKERALSPDEVANIVYEVADALAAAHAKSLVHRDVKPDNLMVRTDGRIALLDFGVAKIAGSAPADPFAATTTGEGMIVGTPAYLAPEQARGEAIGPATDQFALAVTAYELLTQSLPWPTTTPMLLVASIVSSEPKPLTGFDPSVESAIGRALSKSPSDRFDDVRDFAAALGASLAVAHPSRPRSLVPLASSSRSRLPDGVPSAPRSAPRAIEIDKTLRATESARENAPPPRSNRPRILRALGLGLAGLALVGWLFAHRAQTPSTPVPSAPDADGPLAIADIPSSPTSNADAHAKFREAMRMLSRGGDNASIFAPLDAAIAADPEFASAHLQRAFASFRVAGGLDANGRRAYNAALERKEKLSARDAELLAALGPSFADPPDWQLSGARLEAMGKARPGDAQVWEALGILRFKQSRLEDAAAAFTREQAADPNAFTAYFLRGHLRADLGDLVGARQSFAECIERIPTTIECRGGLASMHRLEGDCDAADRVAREAAVLAPDQPLVYTMRAEAAGALGAPDEALVDLLAQKRAHLPEARRAREQWRDAYALAMRRGDFTSALAALESLASSQAEGTLEDLGAWAIERSRVLAEMGERTKSGAAATSFLDRMTARVLPEQPVEDPTGRLLALANAGGAISNADYAARRDAWVSGWRTRLGDAGWKNDGLNVWLGAWAGAADPTPERATNAFAVLHDYGTYDARRADVSTRQYDPEIGALFLAAGKLEDANLRLRDATRACKLAPPVRAFYSYGETRAKLGDVPGACAAFNTVEEKWRNAKPRSVTLEAARAAMKQYACVKKL